MGLGLGLGFGFGLDLDFAVWVSALQSTFMQLFSACGVREVRGRGRVRVRCFVVTGGHKRIGLDTFG